MDNAKQKDLLKSRINFEENVFGNTKTYDKVINNLLEDSKFIALSLRYPYQDYSLLELPKKYYNWQIRACVDLYNRIGNEGIKTYSENGLSWTRDSDNISNGLIDEIEPLVGYIESEEE